MKINIQLVFIINLMMLSNSIFGQSPNIILGRPTQRTITASILFDQQTYYALEYGKGPGVYTLMTPERIAAAGQPEEAEMDKLETNTTYYYRVRYRTTVNSGYQYSPIYSFHTPRAAGSGFTFTIESDEHLYDKKGIPSIYKICLANQAADKPDFMLSLGDIFGDDHNPFDITSAELAELHLAYRPYLGTITHSIPFYISLGNHEGENDYYFGQNAGNNLCVWGTQWRKFYYPNPYPNDFYSGNTQQEPYGIGHPENYYAWTWGDALFVVLDAYRDQSDTTPKPKGWDWSLGKPQYDWLTRTLETSRAKYKFVFAHHMLGQGRGGIVNAKLFEWGGYEQNRTDYTFTQKRPGWPKPIHKLFVDNGVTIFFQGHDHVFAYEELDGVGYLAVPMPSDSTYMIGKLANADTYTANAMEGTGHIRVNVSPTCVKAEFVRAYLPADTLLGKGKNREIAFSKVIGDCPNIPANNSNMAELRVIPNPAGDRIDIRYTGNSAVQHIRICNAFGQTLITSKSMQINTAGLPNGIYLVHVQLEDQRITQKLYVLH